MSQNLSQIPTQNSNTIRPGRNNDNDNKPDQILNKVTEISLKCEKKWKELVKVNFIQLIII